MNGSLCMEGEKHLITSQVLSLDDPDQEESTCSVCHHPVHRFWLDGDEDRSGRWSPWIADKFLIQELP